MQPVFQTDCLSILKPAAYFGALNFLNYFQHTDLIQMQISNEIILSFIHCPYKAYRKCQSEFGEISDFEKFFSELKHSQKFLFMETLSIARTQIGSHSEENNSTHNFGTIFNPKFTNPSIEIILDGIEFKDENKAIPILLTPFEKVTETDKLFVSMQASFIQSQFNINIESCKIVSGKNFKQTKFKLFSTVKTVNKLLNDLDKVLSNLNAPTFFRNPHCQVCEFQKNCFEKLRESDDLSLLGGLRRKEIQRLNKNGIFSIFQYSFTFKPRKQKKYSKIVRLDHSLKALSIREKCVYIKEIPKFSKSQVNIFLDIEGVIDEGYIYLIGLFIKDYHGRSYYSFWANSAEEEEKIFIEFINTILSFPDLQIFYYGNYDIRSLGKIAKRVNAYYQKEFQKIELKSINLHSTISNKLYFPTYTNGLKDIANHIGYSWTQENASGLQSVIHRKNWESNRAETHKKWLIEYNRCDCEALSVLYSWILQIENVFGNNNKLFKNVSEIPKIHYQKWGDPNFQLSDFEKINKASYFNYQRNKVFLKTDKNINKAIKKTVPLSPKINKVNKFIESYLPVRCPNCNYNEFNRLNDTKKVIIDLKFTESGIKKWVTQMTGNVYQCCNCKEHFAFNKYGRNLTIWAINQNIKYLTSMSKIKNMILEYFHLWIPEHILTELKPRLAKEYQNTYDEIRKKLIQSHLIQIDETKTTIKGNDDGYVWVFANMENVYYLYRQNRETKFLKEFLKDFQGVLISDFYAGYEALPCSQQKCLVHLIRDLNNDLLNNQFNDEYKKIVTDFGKLLRAIIDTIDKYGLKKRYLKKHEVFVDAFFSDLINKGFQTELAIKWQKRFNKNRKTLFTFLKYDNIPWNNNNVENAIKPFAKYRATAKGFIQEKFLNDHLVLLSIEQTCKYRGINFLDFLKSEQKSIDH